MISVLLFLHFRSIKVPASQSTVVFVLVLAGEETLGSLGTTLLFWPTAYVNDAEKINCAISLPTCQTCVGFASPFDIPFSIVYCCRPNRQQIIITLN